MRDNAHLSRKIISSSFSIQLYSNGALVNQNVIDLFDKYGHTPQLIVSYDGVNGWHDWLRGVDGAGLMAERAIRLWHKRGWPVNVQLTLHKGNAESLRGTVKYLASLGCDAVRIGSANDEGEWITRSENFSLSANEYYDIVLRYIPDYFADGMPIDLESLNCIRLSPKHPDEFILLLMHDGKCEHNKLLMSCTGRRIQILPDSHVSICHGLGEDYLKTAPIASDDPDVQTVHLMEGCRGSALQNGSLMGKNPISCEVFKGGLPRKLAEAVHRVRPSAHPAIHLENIPQ